MIKELQQGAHYVTRGFGLLNQRGIRPYALIPLLINSILFSLVIWYGVDRFEVLLDWLLPSWLDWARYLLWPLFVILTLLIVFYTFTLIANLIGAPFNALLAEKLEAKLTGQALPEFKGYWYLLKSINTAIFNELKKLLYLAAWILPLLLLFVIPGVNLIAPFAWFIFSAWMLAIEYADYPMGNYDMKFTDERRLLKQNRPLALGFGGAMMLMTSIPILNFIAMPVGVAGATALWVERLRKQAIDDQQLFKPH